MADSDLQSEVATLKQELRNLAEELGKLAGVVVGLSGTRPVVSGASIASGVQSAAQQIAIRLG